MLSACPTPAPGIPWDTGRIAGLRRKGSALLLEACAGAASQGMRAHQLRERSARSRAGREHWGQGYFSRSWAGLQSPRHLRVQWAPPFQPNAGPVGTSSVRRVQEGPASDPGSPHLWPTGASCPEKTSGAAPSCRTAAPAAATRGAQGPRLTLRSPSTSVWRGSRELRECRTQLL